MKIAFCYSKGRPEGFADRAFAGKALGGSEASMIFYAEAFAKLGHTVTIHTPDARQAKRDGVTWHDSKMGLWRRGQDVVIAVRFPEALASAIAPVRALYCCDPEIPELPQYATLGFVNLVITISQHQRREFQRLHPIPEQLYFVSNAGVNLADYPAKDNYIKYPGRCLYCSVPDRGLKYLVEIWPMLKKECPPASLHVTGGFELWGLDVPLSSQPALQKLIAMEADPKMNVKYLGVVPRRKLVLEQQAAQVMLLPGNENSPEMCCISAMECAAAGAVLVVGAVGALPERVDGTGTTGRAVGRGGRWQQAFAETAADYLRLPSWRLQINGSFARRDVEKYDYSILASQWLEQFERVRDAAR